MLVGGLCPHHPLCNGYVQRCYTVSFIFVGWQQVSRLYDRVGLVGNTLTFNLKVMSSNPDADRGYVDQVYTKN